MYSNLVIVKLLIKERNKRFWRETEMQSKNSCLSPPEHSLRPPTLCKKAAGCDSSYFIFPHPASVLGGLSHSLLSLESPHPVAFPLRWQLAKYLIKTTFPSVYLTQMNLTHQIAERAPDSSLESPCTPPSHLSQVLFTSCSCSHRNTPACLLPNWGMRC